MGMTGLAMPAAAAEEPPPFTDEQRAAAFGQLPSLWGPRLSPDGSRLVMITQPAKLDMPVAVVHDFAGRQSKLVLASEEDEFDLRWCRWANDERLLCGFSGVGNIRGVRFGARRLVAVDADGSDMRVLLQRQLANEGVFAQFQDGIIDWLPADRTHVLIEVPDNRGVGLGRLDIESGRISMVKRPREHVRRWITDGSSEPRLRLKWTDDELIWQHRKPGGRSWQTIWKERPGDENDDFQPIGFGDDPNRLLAFRTIDGRKTLVSEDLVGEGGRETVFARGDVDLAGVETLGPHDRIVAVTWETERPHVEYFDPSLDRVDEAIRKVLPGKAIVIADESWGREVFVVLAYSDVDPGSYYRLDVKAGELAWIGNRRPALDGRTLAQMEPLSYATPDGAIVPGYVTRPIGAGPSPAPTIVMPHGGPSARDVWGFDWLAQFLASSGYVVFQPNYRGSAGYGEDWQGDGAFKEWRRALADIEAGVQHLVETGLSDPERICGVGWSFGGWAVLLGALEYPERYRCVVDIAGVTDPAELIDHYRDFLNAEWVEEFVSRSDDVLKRGSAVKRAEEFRVPVLIFQPDEDLNVDVEHGRKLAKALRKAGRSVEYVEYEDDEHAIESHASRTDMLARIGRFLAEHLAEPPAQASGADGDASEALAAAPPK